MEILIIIGIFVVIGAVAAFIQQSNNQKQLDSMRDAITAFTPAFTYSSSVTGYGIAADVDLTQFSVMNTKSSSSRTYQAADLLKIELFEDGDSITSTSRSSQAGGALVGGLLFGGAGAIVGGLTGGKRTKQKVKTLELRLLVNDKFNPTCDIGFLSLETTRDSMTYKAASQSARTWYGYFEMMMKNAADKLPSKVDQSNSSNFAALSDASETAGLSVATELEKLISLKSSGALTDTEFQKLKEKLLQ